jgi:Flp pilus assembly protein TadG
MGTASFIATRRKRFLSTASGTVGILFALAAIPVFLAVGVATDYVRASAVQARLQSTLDAATLAAAASKGMNDADRIKLAKAMFEENWKTDPSTKHIKVFPVFTIAQSAITGTADIEMPTALMQLAGIEKMAIGSDVTVTIPEEKKVELALVLDYSLSMTNGSGGKVKYVAMREAANKLVADLAESIPDKLKVGLVPFSHHVYLTLPKTHVAGQVGTGNWTGCTQDRKYPYNVGGAAPLPDNEDSKWGQPQAPDHIWNDCSPYAPNKLVILPLTSDMEKVTGQLNSMLPNSWTHIALGVEFGYHLLSSGAPFTEGADFSDKTTQKFMVALTDGEQTEPAFGPNGVRDVPQGEANLEKLCAAAKASGITMITVAFDLYDVDTKNRLSGCSSDPSKYFFIAEDDAEIAKAFEEIKKQITAQVYVSK